MGLGHDKEEAVDSHWKISAMTFDSEAAAYVFYNNYAKDHGCSIRKENVKRGKGRTNTLQTVCVLQSRKTTRKVFDHDSTQTQAKTRVAFPLQSPNDREV